VQASERTSVVIGLSISEAAKAASLGRSSIYEALGRGSLVGKKLGRRTIILDSDLRAFLAALRPAKPQS
jgi:hypothetical protein